jgi:hypothetical protein
MRVTYLGPTPLQDRHPGDMFGTQHTEDRQSDVVHTLATSQYWPGAAAYTGAKQRRATCRHATSSAASALAAAMGAARESRRRVSGSAHIPLHTSGGRRSAAIRTQHTGRSHGEQHTGTSRWQGAHTQGTKFQQTKREQNLGRGFGGTGSKRNVTVELEGRGYFAVFIGPPSPGPTTTATKYINYHNECAHKQEGGRGHLVLF